MRKTLKDEEITKILKKMGKTPVDGMAYDRVWFKVEERLEKREKGFLNNIVWRPWGHPIRWVAAVACLMLAFSGFLTHVDIGEKNDMANYLINVSNTPENVTQDPGIVKVSILLSEPSSSAPNMSVDNHADPLSADEIFL